MSQSRDIYNALVENGIDSDRAAEIAEEETGNHPLKLSYATVLLNIEVEVELDEYDLAGLSEEDTDEIEALAKDKVDMPLDFSVTDSEVTSAETDDN